MKTFQVDLYEYYKVKKPNSGKGILHGYVFSNSIEIDKNRKNPAMLVLPGGGYGFTSEREEEPIALRFLSYGFISFWLEYSVRPVKYPYSLTEARMAMNYIRENAESLTVDSNKISAVGFSAGGHLCALLGSDYDNADSKELFNGNYSSRPDALILSYPVITSQGKTHIGSFTNLCGDDKELIKKLDILNLVHEKSSPAFIWSTRDDACVPVRNSVLLAEKYEEKGVNFALHIFGKGIHGLSLADNTVYGTEEFKSTTSVDIPMWVDLAVNWLRENGLCF